MFWLVVRLSEVGCWTGLDKTNGLLVLRTRHWTSANDFKNVHVRKSNSTKRSDDRTVRDISDEWLFFPAPSASRLCRARVPQHVTQAPVEFDLLCWHELYCHWHWVCCGMTIGIWRKLVQRLRRRPSSEHDLRCGGESWSRVDHGVRTRCKNRQAPSLRQHRRWCFP